MRFILLLLLTVTTSVFAQRTQTIDADCLRIRDGVCIDKSELGYLDGSTSNIQTQINAKAATITGAATSIATTDLATSMALQSDASGKVEASATVSSTELGYVDGATSNIQTQLNTLGTSVSTNDTNAVHKTGDESISGTKTFTGKLVTSSTVNGSIPCPVMTEIQRDAIAAPVLGDCITNSTTNSLNVYNGSLWKAAGGGLSDWETTFSYAIGDIVIESDKIYQALVAHTSGTFATDLAAAKWIRLNDELTVNTATGKTLEVPYKQATEVSTDKIRIETGNKNRLQDGGFENSIPSAYLTGISCTGTANPIPSAETTSPIEGKQSLVIAVSGGASGGVCTIYQDADTFHALDGIVSMYLKSDTQAGVVFIKRVNGAEAVRIDPNASNTYRDIVSNPVLFKIPGAMGTTSTGVGVEVTVAASQTIVVTMDEAKVGMEDVKTDATRIESQSSYFNNSTVLNNSAVTGSPSATTGVGLYSYDSLSGIYTALKTIKVGASLTLQAEGAASVLCSIRKNGSSVFRDSSLAVTSSSCSASGDMVLSSGDTFQFVNISTNNSNNTTASIVATTADNTEQFSTAADFFSTDTNTLAFKATAITDSDPVGTFNTYSYDGAPTASNNKTICGSAPTQLIADMKTNGIKIFTRAYNADSTCENPARVEVKIAKAGTSLPTLSKELYKSAGKLISGIMDYSLISSNATQYGFSINSYDSATGILIVDAGYSRQSTITAAALLMSDGSTSASGYLVINAQPKKTTAVQDFAEFDYVYVGANGNGGEAITVNVTPIPFIEVEDSHNAWNGNTFTTPTGKAGLYEFTSCTTWATSNYRSQLIVASISGSKRLSPILPSAITTASNCGTAKIKLSEGETVVLNEGQNGGNVSNSTVSHWLTITRIPGQFR